MAKKNPERRKWVAEFLAHPREGNSNHPRWGMVGLRYNATPMKNGEYYPVAVITIPAKHSAKIADAFARDQQYTCRVAKNGQIIFIPTEGGTT